jgi:N-acylneuraminate cytidylyltransferase
MKIYTVIPARSGSKSIPKKNIRPLKGKPLLQYSVEYSLKCPLVSRTVVSTDSEEFAKIARNCGADVPFIRPAELAQDDTQDYPVMRHALDILESIYKEQIDLLVLLRPTSPFRPPRLIERAVELLRRAVTASTEHPYRQWVMQEPFMAGFVRDVNEPYNIPRQKLPKVLFQTGDLEMVTRQTLLGGSVSGKNVLPLYIAPDEMLDLDTFSDWEEAERRKS